MGLLVLSVLWRCWSVGCQEGHPAYKKWKWVVRYWRGYLSGARCKWFAYGPADATLSSVAPVKSRMVYLSGVGLPRLSWKKRRLNGYTSSSSSTVGLTVIIGFLSNSGKLLMAVKFDNQPKDCAYSRIQSYDPVVFIILPNYHCVLAWKVFIQSSSNLPGHCWCGTLLPSVLWHCWLGHLTRKNRPRNDLLCV